MLTVSVYSLSQGCSTSLPSSCEPDPTPGTLSPSLQDSPWIHRLWPCVLNWVLQGGTGPDFSVWEPGRAPESNPGQVGAVKDPQSLIPAGWRWCLAQEPSL